MFNHIYNKKNFLWLNLSSATLIVVVNQISVLITLPHLANNLGIYGFAILAKALIVYQIGVVLMDYGCNYCAIYFVKGEEEENIKLKNIILPIYLIKIIIYIFIIIIFSLLNYYFNLTHFDNKLFLSIIFTIFFAGINPYWIYQLLEKNIYLLGSTIISRIFFLYIVFFYIKDETNIYSYFLALGLGFIIINLVGLYHFRFLRLTTQGLSFFFKILKISTRYFLSALININFNSLWGLALLFMGGPIQLVYFNLADQGYRAFYILCSVIPVNLYSRFSKIKNFKTSYKNSIYLSIIIIFIYLCGMLLINPIMIIIFDISYYPASRFIIIYLVASLFLSLSGLFGYPILGILKNSKFVRNIILFGGFLNLFGLVIWVLLLEKLIIYIILLHLFINSFIFFLIIFFIFIFRKRANKLS